MVAKVFIDGAAGTTGLEIRERLAKRGELAVTVLSDDKRKDAAARKAALNGADVVILCLPDDAAREAIALIDNPNVRVIDASTAHRTAPGWVYGFPEYDAAQRGAIRSAKRVTNPGCYAVTFVALAHPLAAKGVLPADWPVSVNAVSGYSGGGKNMIAEFEDEKAANYSRETLRTYALTLDHKHVEEMRVHAGLVHRPLFAPSVGRFYRGMMVDIPLPLAALPGKPKLADVHGALDAFYHGEKMIEVASLEEAASLKTLDAELLKGTDRLKIFVFGNDARGQARVVGVLDNLGKGAAGSAVQNLNVMMGWNETEGLVR